MPNYQSTEQRDIEAVNETVLWALGQLMGMGGGSHLPQSGKTKAALNILRGVGTDHTHQGYKEITMQAFQKGLQRILDDYYVALKILTDPAGMDEKMKEKLADPQNMKFILKILGLNKEERKNILENMPDDPDEKLEMLQDYFISKGPEYTNDRIHRIQLMQTGTLCYLPFSQPYDGQIIHIPAKDANGNYFRAPMTVENYNMNPGIGGPYHAINLHRVHDEPYVQDHLLFMGTNPLPTASGPSVTIHADTHAGKAIGENLVEQSSERFEALIKKQYIDNLKKLLDNPDQFKENGKINYQKLLMAARVKCAGQSLGGSISLQMLVKYPFMVETSAFEPPSLRKHHLEAMHTNILNSDKQMAEIFDSAGLTKEQKNGLQNAIPRQWEDKYSLLQKNNEAIVQLIDYAAKFGEYTPPLTIKHVTTKNENRSQFDSIKDYLYKRLMAFSLMSHAKILAGDPKLEVREYDSMTKLFSQKSRESFTQKLDKYVWPVINKPMSGYIELKNYILNHHYDPKMDPNKHPKYKEANQQILRDQLNAKWKIIENRLKDLKKGGESDGYQLQSQIQDLVRMLDRALLYGMDMRHLNEQIGDAYEAFTKRTNLTPREKLYQEYLYISFNKERMPEKFEAFQKTIYVEMKRSLTQDLSKKDLGNIVERYSMLNHETRMKFIEDLKALPKPHTPSQKKLFSQLESFSLRNSERSAIRSLIKPDKRERFTPLSAFEKIRGKSRSPSSSEDVTSHRRPRKS